MTDKHVMFRVPEVNSPVVCNYFLLGWSFLDS